jgi:hypothetical protein
LHWVFDMYNAVAGACAEREANASSPSYTLENLNFQDSSNATGYTPTELMIGSNKILIAHEPGSAEKIHAFAFDDATHPAWATAEDTISLTNKQPRALCFGDNGNYLYIGGTVASSNIVRRTLSTAYDIGTAGASQTVSSSLYSSGAQGLAFNGDGTKLFVADGGSVITLTLTTAWDLSAGTKATNSFSSTVDSDSDTMGSAFTGIRFNSDGTKMFISYRKSFGDAADTANHAKIAEFDLSTAYTVSTAAFVRSLDTHPQLGYYDFVPAPPPPSTRPTFIGGFDWNSDGTALFVAAVHTDAQTSTGPKILRYTFD